MRKIAGLTRLPIIIRIRIAAIMSRLAPDIRWMLTLPCPVRVILAQSRRTAQTRTPAKALA